MEIFPTETEGEDYWARNETLVITNNSKDYDTVYVNLYYDDVVEGDETFSIRLSSSDSRVRLGLSEVQITINDLKNCKFVIYAYGPCA